MANPNVVSIPSPTPNPIAMLAVLTALKQQVEILSGQRGDKGARAATLNDLVALGVVTQSAVDKIVA
jgi:hypothetical protein